MLLWFTAVAVWLVDRLLKVLIMAYFVPGESLPVIPKVFHLTLVLNSGAAFGLLSGHTVFLILTACLVLGGIFLIQKYWAPSEREIRIALGMIAGGALGNLYDRVTMAEVIDYLDFKIWPYVFNFADSMIVIGVGIILLSFYLQDRQDRKAHE